MAESSLRTSLAAPLASALSCRSGVGNASKRDLIPLVELCFDYEEGVIATPPVCSSSPECTRSVPKLHSSRDALDFLESDVEILSFVSR